MIVNWQRVVFNKIRHRFSFLVLTHNSVSSNLSVWVRNLLSREMFGFLVYGLWGMGFPVRILPLFSEPVFNTGICCIFKMSVPKYADPTWTSE